MENADTKKKGPIITVSAFALLLLASLGVTAVLVRSYAQTTVNGNPVMPPAMYSQSGAPPSSVGADGDSYFDNSSNLLYTPKAGGVWPAPRSLIGPAGATGQQGIQGIQGVQGVQGNPGVAGTNGTNGTDANAAYGYPTARTLIASTAYQCTNTTKPCIVTLNLTSTASFSLTGGSTNTASLVLGSTSGVATGTGTTVGLYSNSSTATVAVGVGVTGVQANAMSIFVPVGGYFAWRVTAGTVTVTSAYEQQVG